MAHISAETAQELKNIIHQGLEGIPGLPGVPGITCSVRNREGDPVFEYAAGMRGLGLVDAPMTGDSVLWIASCTKLITSIAAMQLVEENLISLDSGAEVEAILPELRDIKVVEERADGSLEYHDKKRKITLRMLLSHTGMCFVPKGIIIFVS